MFHNANLSLLNRINCNDQVTFSRTTTDIDQNSSYDIRTAEETNGLS